MIGPAAFEGPALATVSEPVPVPPGTMGVVDDDVVRSADPGATAIDDGVELFAGVGSLVAVETPAVPPVRATPGIADAGMLI